MREAGVVIRAKSQGVFFVKVKEFGSYLEDNGMPLKSFKGGSIRY